MSRSDWHRTLDLIEKIGEGLLIQWLTLSEFGPDFEFSQEDDLVTGDKAPGEICFACWYGDWFLEAFFGFEPRPEKENIKLDPMQPFQMDSGKIYSFEMSTNQEDHHFIIFYDAEEPLYLGTYGGVERFTIFRLPKKPEAMIRDLVDSDPNRRAQTYLEFFGLREGEYSKNVLKFKPENVKLWYKERPLWYVAPVDVLDFVDQMIERQNTLPDVNPANRAELHRIRGVVETYL